MRSIGDTPAQPDVAENIMILTVEDVAKRLRVPISWVYERSRRRGADRIPHRKLGKYLRFLATEVDEWFNSLPGN